MHLTWPADIRFIIAYFYFDIITYPTLLNHVKYLLLMYHNLSTKFILRTFFFKDSFYSFLNQLFKPIHCDNSSWLISLPLLIRWSSECSDVQVQASFFQLFLMFLSVSKYLNTSAFSTCLPDYLFSLMFLFSSLGHHCTFYFEIYLFLLSSVPAYNLSVPSFIWNVTLIHQDALCNNTQCFLLSPFFIQINLALLLCPL